MGQEGYGSLHMADSLLFEIRLINNVAYYYFHVKVENISIFKFSKYYRMHFFQPYKYQGTDIAARPQVMLFISVYYLESVIVISPIQ